MKFCLLLCAAEEVIKEIEDFDCLEALRLEGNTVGVEAAKVIAKALEKKSQLKVRTSVDDDRLFYISSTRYEVW